MVFVLSNTQIVSSVLWRGLSSMGLASRKDLRDNEIVNPLQWQLYKHLRWIWNVPWTSIQSRVNRVPWLVLRKMSIKKSFSSPSINYSCIT